ncbi:major facilitator family transporter [Gregarina niphandrodes]|uniref:Major facilitator family transporter n=1 Tax=Gregarina niphandrodes TaxID=110365 RepID=A0A023AY10_GRENI|nr:major facilitator family transporter [Gregarina niphandrodes]EZG43539.1 major facilitator family transporter [Gregarina niphandrodes]|eukprot:XP_011133224.1 major facilitator family transporter [Gregarina niphandrodes]
MCDKHGIVPAAIPQLRALFNTSAFQEAAVQCICVLGTQVGVAIMAIRRVSFSKYTLILAITGITVIDIGTGYLLRYSQKLAGHQPGGGHLPGGGHQPEGFVGSLEQKLGPFLPDIFHHNDGLPHTGIKLGSLSTTLPYWLYGLRFLAGLIAAYPIHCIPRWINQSSAHSQAAAQQAKVQLAGVMGTVAGYVLVLVPPLLSFPPFRGHNFTVSFKLAGIICSIVALIGLVAVRQAEFPGSTAEFNEQITLDIQEEDHLMEGSFAGSILMAGSALVHPLYGRHGERPEAVMDHWYDSLLTSTPMYSKITTPYTQDEPSFLPLVPSTETGIGQQLKAAAGNLPFVCVNFAVWVNTSVSQALAFWIFTVYTTRLNISKPLALTGITSVFGVGTILGLSLASLLKFKDVETIRRDRVDPIRFRWIALLSGLTCTAGSVCAVTMGVNRGFVLSTLTMTLSVLFGSAVIPIAQATIASCLPSYLEDTAYGVYQTVFQSSWFFGPLLPVVIAWLCGGQAEVEGFRGVMLLPVLAFVACLVSYRHVAARATLKRNVKKEFQSEGVDDETLELSSHLNKTSLSSDTHARLLANQIEEAQTATQLSLVQP